ncbi:uncharacterized protein LOC100162028 [Acyrthosiphon pisum]|uniref:Uncharacterized protein n=1 Tax=Acyrthosiphon pisum TaxID=7029 RepID=A0A8R2B4M6_ACYPI|nr:uncharacterized protein LOC100162028 [Acyrthosiphon pisum]|eukprot:XP_008181493.1 PREDICTED: uncharacterized protein LOC100162028 [Acyrthosiphon pisum]
MMDRDISPVKRNPPGKFVGVRQKLIIINFYKNLMFEQQNIEESKKMKYKDIIKTISKTSGVGQRTVGSTLAEYKTKGTISSPNKKKEEDSDRKIRRFWPKRH